jgi:hypothetical protein
MSKLSVTSANENITTWSERDYLTTATKESVRNADVLIVPVENFRESEKPLFPVQTSALYRFVKDNLPNNLNLEIAIEDEDYREFALYSDTENIAQFIVTLIALPFLISVLANYFTTKLFAKDKANIDVKITVQIDENVSKTISFEGTAEDFRHASEEIQKLCTQETPTLAMSENISKELAQIAIPQKRKKSKKR